MNKISRLSAMILALIFWGLILQAKRSCRAGPCRARKYRRGSSIPLIHRALASWKTSFTNSAETSSKAIPNMRFSLTALQQPGPAETRTANLAKRVVIRLASRRGIPAPPVDTRASIEAGGTHYGLDCGICHGVDGRAQTPSGQWMYPRAADLTSQQVQSYSDQELFWIINNGIRFTGMPGFGKVETPDHIWALVNYVRTLPNAK